MPKFDCVHVCVNVRAWVCERVCVCECASVCVRGYVCARVYDLDVHTMILQVFVLVIIQLTELRPLPLDLSVAY